MTNARYSEFNLRPEFLELIPQNGAKAGHPTKVDPGTKWAMTAQRMQQMADQINAAEAQLAQTTGAPSTALPNAFSELNSYTLSEVIAGLTYRLDVTHTTPPSAAWYVFKFPSENFDRVNIEVAGLNGEYPLLFNNRRVKEGELIPSIPELVFFDGSAFHLMNRRNKQSLVFTVGNDSDFLTILGAVDYVQQSYPAGTHVKLLLADQTHILDQPLSLVNNKVQVSLEGSSRNNCLIDNQSGENYAIRLFYGQTLQVSGLTLSGGGIYADFGSVVTNPDQPISVTNAPASAVLSSNKSVIRLSGPQLSTLSTTVHCVSANIDAAIYIDGATITGGHVGCFANNGSLLIVSQSQVSGYSSSGFMCQVSSGGNCSGSTFTGGVYGVRAFYGANIFASGVNTSGNTAFSPAANTLVNRNSFISN